jgi:hypothetical protein
MLIADAIVVITLALVVVSASVLLALTGERKTVLDTELDPEPAMETEPAGDCTAFALSFALAFVAIASIDDKDFFAEFTFIFSFSLPLLGATLLAEGDWKAAAAAAAVVATGTTAAAAAGGSGGITVE